MKVKIIKEHVVSGFQKAAHIIPTKTGAAFLRTIWIDAKNDQLTIMSTDSNLEFSGTYPATVEQEGLVGVQGRKFFDLFRKLPPGEITLSFENEQQSLLLEQGKRKFRLPTNDSSWFQNFAPFPESNAVFWSGEYLQDIIERIAYCVGDEDEMEGLNCMMIKPQTESGDIAVCGLNNHQFALQKLNNPDISALLDPEGILIAKRYLLELKKWLTNEEIYFSIDKRRLFFSNEDKSEVFSLPLSYYEFPNYESFFETFEGQTTLMQVGKEELIDSLDRISIFNTENQRCCYFVFDEQELVLYSQGQETGEATESLPISIQGEMSQIAFPTKNLIDILNHFHSSRLSFYLTTEDGPCKITGEDDPEYIVLIMPILISEETYYTEETV
jgi:DNA polymerase-3 subunit beta